MVEVPTRGPHYQASRTRTGVLKLQIGKGAPKKEVVHFLVN